MRVIGVLMLLAGCEIGIAATPDTPGDPGDGSQHGLGMFVTWKASPMLPGALTDKITVSNVTFQLDHFQIVADAGNVMHTKYLLAWDSNGRPQEDAFHDAPPGVYSKITLSMMTGSFGDYAYQIHGTWRDIVPKDFEIEDRVPLSVSLDCNTTLAVAGSATIGIEVDLKDAISGIDFRNLDEEDGVLQLHDGQELFNFRSRLQNAFKLAN